LIFLGQPDGLTAQPSSDHRGHRTRNLFWSDLRSSGYPVASRGSAGGRYQKILLLILTKDAAMVHIDACEVRVMCVLRTTLNINDQLLDQAAWLLGIQEKTQRVWNKKKEFVVSNYV